MKTNIILRRAFVVVGNHPIIREIVSHVRIIEFQCVYSEYVNPDL